MIIIYVMQHPQHIFQDGKIATFLLLMDGEIVIAQSYLNSQKINLS